jgi:hypothetical protein
MVDVELKTVQGQEEKRCGRRDRQCRADKVKAGAKAIVKK